MNTTPNPIHTIRRFQIPTYAFISAQPNPVGVGQQVSLDFWLDKVPPTANGPYGDRWQNYTVKVTSPDGTSKTLGPFTSDDAGGAHTYFVPTAIGNYTFMFSSYSGQTLAGANPAPQGTIAPASIGDYYQPSTFCTLCINCTAEPMPYLPVKPSPNRILASPHIWK